MKFEAVQGKQGGGTCYQVYSIHALVHAQRKTHIVYAVEVDSFFYDEKSKQLTPVEIKCSPVKKNVEPAFWQARLGKVERMVFAHYENKYKDSKGVWRWTVRLASENCEKEQIPLKCVIGKCEHKKSNPEATTASVRKCEREM
ncbi:unnamed protein product [Orchesella dallaii]|uniref:PD(D/E)XK endonuclease domain-containing protein n=1 Tax=Orchesella dallaii TaxID=48710 RepID=A0ABP1PL89_9HEXA